MPEILDVWGAIKKYGQIPVMGDKPITGIMIRRIEQAQRIIAALKASVSTDNFAAWANANPVEADLAKYVREKVKQNDSPD